jgi:ankyrin repeat/BTB/POZ domain-containing protein 1
MMDEDEETEVQLLAEKIDSLDSGNPLDDELLQAGVVRTLDGEIAGDEFEEDARNYQILLGKIDTLLESLKLDA